MLKKIKIILLLTACAIISAHAQYNVLINPTVGGYQSKLNNDTLIHTVKEAIGEIGYINLVEADANDSETNDYEIDLRINDIIFTGQENHPDSDPPYVSYTHRVLITIEIVDLSKGIVTASSALAKNGFGESHKESMIDGIESFKKDIKKFILDKLPYYGKILELTESKGNKAKMLYISIGSKVGIIKGQKLAVKAAATTAGRLYFKSLGTVKVEEVEGEFGSRCKVTYGGEKIYEAYLDDPEHIAVMTIK